MSERTGPSPATRYPAGGAARLGFLNQFITRPGIIVGDYTYYDDPRGPEHFEDHVLYHFDFIGDRLVIGRYCAIAAEATFIMNGGNHVTDALSTYPFAIFGEGWESAAPAAWPNRGDTVVGNDVWIGYRATIMPGIRIGDGAIIGSCSVVTRDVPPYAVVGGNPAGVIRMRFDAPVIERLLAAAWWDWPADKVTRNLPALTGNDPAALDRLR
ncbi:MAG: CatB-related O-acetyltransferase [Bacillota bacterium]